MSAVRRIALLMDNRGDSNWGSQATTTALVGLLSGRYPGAEIVGVPRHVLKPPRPLRAYLENSAPERLRTGKGKLAEWLVTRPLAAVWKGADLVVVNGEGTLHPQRQLLWWLPAICLLQERFPKPLRVVNTSINFVGSEQAWMFERLLPLVERVVVRDHYSFSELQTAGFECVQAADCAYLTEPNLETIGGLLEQVGVSGDYAVLTGSIEGKKWPIQTQRDLVEHLRSRGMDVVFTSSTTQDDLLYQKLGLELPLITHKQAGFRELMALQGAARLLVGGRYHPTILAALMGTPFVALPSNTTKMDALMEVLGTERYFLGPEQGSELLAAVDLALENEGFFRSEVKTRAEAQRELARLNAG